MTRTLTSWESFEHEIENLFSLVDDIRAKKAPLHVPYPLFRGHSHFAWDLESTLDRIRKNMSLYEYHAILQRIKPSIETCTGLKWDLPEFEEVKKSSDLLFYCPPEQVYNFMIYLRQHKFPSPLLDWTASPYIAAYFAFNEITSNDNVAIFSYIEYLGGKSMWGEGPMISNPGSMISTHKRHYLQQSEYTICVKKENKATYYWSHEDVLRKEETEQNIITKYILPGSEKTKVLKKLDLMNINGYSLFNNEDELMRTLSIRSFVTKYFV